MKTQTLKRIFDPLKSSYYIGFIHKKDVAPVLNLGVVTWLDTNGYEKIGWYADPFILSINEEEIELLAEEWNYEIGHGILVLLTIAKKTKTIINRQIVLQRDTHLSYPIIMEDQDEIYVYPENSENGCVSIYRYDKTNKMLVDPKVIISKPLLDTQIALIDGIYYAFGVEYVTGKQEDTKKLDIFCSNSLLGEYHYLQSILNIKCEERGAGQIFFENNRIVRPAQCCEGGYGKSVIFYELIKENGFFKEKELYRLQHNPKEKNCSILHTYNSVKDLIVIDGFSYKYPRISRAYKLIRRIND